MFSFFRSKNVSDKVNYGLGNVDEVAKQNIPLSVPFSQKDDAKLLGAKWNPTLKRWFIPKGAKVSKFDKWKMIFNDDLINPPIYLSSSNTKCWKCSKQTRVFSLAAEHIVNLDKIEYIDSGLSLNDYIDQCIDLESDRFIYFSYLKNIPNNIELAIKSCAPTYYLDYSNTTKSRYYMNHCYSCKSKIGDHYQYGELEGAFMAEKSMTMIDLDIKRPVSIKRDI